MATNSKGKRFMISEKLFNDLNDLLGLLAVEQIANQSKEPEEIAYRKRIQRLHNVLCYLSTNRSLNDNIDYAIAGYNESLANQYIRLKVELKNNLSAEELELL